jgi:hypothetical protein
VRASACYYSSHRKPITKILGATIGEIRKHALSRREWTRNPVPFGGRVPRDDERTGKIGQKLHGSIRVVVYTDSCSGTQGR